MTVWHATIWAGGVALLVNGLVHWLYIGGRLTEDLRGVPAGVARGLEWYSRALAALDVLAGLGVLALKPFGWWLALLIVLSQFPAHGAVICYKRRRGIRPEFFRYTDLAVAASGAVLLWMPPVRALFGFS